VVSVGHEEAGGSILFPEYLIYAELLSDLAAVWYGKRFDVHGKLQQHGGFFLPAMTQFGPTPHPEAGPFNHRSRKDLDIELNWDNFLTPFQLFVRYGEDEADDNLLGAFWNATRFYSRALRAFCNDPEVAFFHLIVSMEMLANAVEMTDEQMFGGDNLELLEKIRTQVGVNEAKEVQKRFRQLRRRVAASAEILTNRHYFQGSEARHDFGRITEGDLSRRVKAAYDLRSKYAHGGARFGSWLQIFSGLEEEIQHGVPVIKDKELKKLITDAPTLIGLERLVRFMILRFGHTRILKIHSGLE